MRILYHHRTRGEDAQGVHIAELIAAFRGLGHTVEVVSPGGNGRGSATLGSLTRKLPRRQTWLYEILELAYNVVGMWALIRSASKFRPDFIYERYALYMFCGLIVGKVFRVPFILEVNAPLSRERSPLMFQRLAGLIERWVCSQATITIAVSLQLAAYLQGQGVPSDRVVVMPNGVDPKLFDANTRADNIRAYHGLRDKIVVGFVGWMRSWHNLLFAIEAFADHKLGERGGHLLLVGDGPAFAALAARVAQRGLQAHVTFAGPVPRQDVVKYIAAMDIAIQPGSTPYASPIKIFEYMAMGRAIVAVAQPNIEEVLSAGENALLFPPGDPHAFGQALARLIEDQDLRERLGRSARETIERRALYWKSNADSVLNLVADRVNRTAHRGDSSTPLRPDPTTSPGANRP